MAPPFKFRASVGDSAKPNKMRKGSLRSGKMTMMTSLIAALLLGLSTVARAQVCGCCCRNREEGEARWPGTEEASILSPLFPSCAQQPTAIVQCKCALILSLSAIPAALSLYDSHIIALSLPAPPCPPLLPSFPARRSRHYRTISRSKPYGTISGVSSRWYFCRGER